MKEIIKKFIPDSALLFYHKALAWIAAVWYRQPSKELIVIGVTGTNGKSTTVNLIAKILEAAGHRAGLISTVNFKVDKREWLNNLKLTMPGRFYLQKLLRQMVSAGCKYAIVETSSEGIIQYRNIGIDYDMAVFTNLTVEHLASHGGFANYKHTKLKLFQQVASSRPKKIDGVDIPKVIVANVDDQHSTDFLNYQVDRRATYGIEGAADFRAEQVKTSEVGSEFVLDNTQFMLQLLGRFNVYNALAAIATTVQLGVELETARTALTDVAVVPGRMEKIDEGQEFTVLIDQAPEPVSLHQVYQTIKSWQPRHIIHVLGSAGGGRDQGRRPILGHIAAKNADLVIVTNEDPYDEDPQAIIDQVAAGAEQSGKKMGRDLFKIIDRRQAIREALEKAQPKDLVLVTGKGAEQALVVAGGKKIKWDDRKVAREELKKLRS